ncbi:DUF1848 family protein [bacterium]|nr:DUF1848 family protein [bacterium]
MSITEKKIISISRRLDMVAFYPDLIVNTLGKRCPPERVHSLVFWTKWPENLWKHQTLSKSIRHYDQIYVHLTITGMGGSSLEPGIPGPGLVLNMLPELIDIVGDTRRIALRFDPIVNLQDQSGKCYSNFEFFNTVLAAAVQWGIGRIIVSWMSPYDKVIRRLGHKGWKPVTLNKQDRENQWKQLKKLSEDHGIILSACCDPEFPQSACIDGQLLQSLHPQNLPVCTNSSGEQRSRCGCTKSWDIGWYYGCPGGCIYCYANPKIKNILQQ